MLPQDCHASAVIMAHRDGAGIWMGVKVQLFLVGGVPRIRVGLDIDEPATYETFAGTHSGIEFDLSRSHRHVLSIRNSSAPVVASWRAVN
jgi:hypothetical protein